MRFKAPVLVLMLMTFVMGTSEFMIMGILPDMAHGLGVEYTVVGSLVIVYALSCAVFTPTLSAFIGRYNRYRVLIASAILFTISDVWTMLASDYVSLALSRAMTAAISGILFSVGLTFVADLVSPEDKPASVAWMYASFNISSIIGVPVGTILSTALGWRFVFVFILVLSVATIILAAVVLPKGPSSGQETVSVKGATRGLLKDARIWLGFLVTVFGSAGSYAVFTYISPTLEDIIGFPESMVGIGLMLFGVTCLISNLSAGRISTAGGLKRGKSLFLVQALIMAALPTALALSPYTGMAGLMAVGLMMYLMNTSVQMLLMDVANKDYPGAITLASSLNPTAFSIGIMLGSFSAGEIYHSSGLIDIGYGAAVFAAVALILSLAVCRYCSRPGKETSVT